MSILSAFITHLSCTVFLITSFLTTLLSLLKSTGAIINLSISILSTLAFKLDKSDFAANLDMSIPVAIYTFILGNSNMIICCEHWISLVATLLGQQSAQLNKVKERNIRSVCRHKLFRSLRAHQYSSDQMKILKDWGAKTTGRVVNVAYRLWLPLLTNKVLNITKLRSEI